MGYELFSFVQGNIASYEFQKRKFRLQEEYPKEIRTKNELAFGYHISEWLL